MKGGTEAVRLYGRRTLGAAKRLVQNEALLTSWSRFYSARVSEECARVYLRRARERLSALGSRREGV